MRGEQIHEIETEVATQDGSRRHLVFSGIAIRGQDGEVELVIMVGRDITDMVGRHARTREMLGEIRSREIKQVNARRRIEEFYRREHNIAENLQMSFLPRELPETGGFEIGHHYEAALDEAKVGGDFYDVFALGAGRFGVVIADTAGKGLKAALYSAMTKYMLRAYALEDEAPETVLARLNAALSVSAPPEVFVTLVYGVLDVGKKTYVYANAGHEPLIVYSGAQKSASMLELTGSALALGPRAGYAARTVAVEPGDAMVLYTDGLTDAGSGAHRMGHDRVLNVLEESASLSASEMAESLISAATDYAGGKLGDDAAILVIKRPEER